jgi:hypothetical protein
VAAVGARALVASRCGAGAPIAPPSLVRTTQSALGSLDTLGAAPTAAPTCPNPVLEEAELELCSIRWAEVPVFWTPRSKRADVSELAGGSGVDVDVDVDVDGKDGEEAGLYLGGALPPSTDWTTSPRRTFRENSVNTFTCVLATTLTVYALPLLAPSCTNGGVPEGVESAASSSCAS